MQLQDGVDLPGIMGLYSLLVNRIGSLSDVDFLSDFDIASTGPYFLCLSWMRIHQKSWRKHLFLWAGC